MRLSRQDRTELFAKRRKDILAAARRIFSRDGYGDADLEEIAAALEISKGTIYRYFKSKKALFLAVADAGMAKLQSIMDSQVVTEPDPERRIERAVSSVLGFCDENADLMEIFVHERARFRDRRKPTCVTYRDKHIGGLERTLDQLATAGKLRPVDARVVTGVVGDLLFGMWVMRYFQKSRRPLAVLAPKVVDFIFHGILKK